MWNVYIKSGCFTFPVKHDYTFCSSRHGQCSKKKTVLPFSFINPVGKVSKVWHNNNAIMLLKAHRFNKITE